MSSVFNKTTIIIAISCILIGRYVLTPKQKVKEVEVIKIVEVEKKHTEIKKKKTIKETTNSEGTIIKETTETEDTVVDSDRSTKIDSSKTSQSGSGITLGLLAVFNANEFADKPEYGATVSVPVLGNLNAQAIVTTDKRIGVGLSIGF